MEASLACGAGCVAGLAAFYRLARPHFSVRVNCHFCSQDARVPYSQANSFSCPHCEQYNGWDSAGDYNKQMDMVGNQGNRFVREQVPGAIMGNGLCRSCNLNQELKVSQLARFNKEGRELEEYRQHLEKVYRLCPDCEDVLATKLGEQDRKLANKLIEFKLERSRMNSSLTRIELSQSWLPYMQCMLSIAIFSLLQDYNQIQVPAVVKEAMSKALNTTVPLQLTISSYLDTMFPFISISEVIIPFTEMLSLPQILVTLTTILLLVFLCNKAFLSCVLYTILLLTYWTSAPHIVQLTLAGIGVIAAVLTTPPTPHNTIITSKGSARLSESFQHYQQSKIDNPEVEDTLTQDLLDTSSVSHVQSRPSTPPCQPPTPSPPLPLPVAKLFTSTPPANTLMRTRDEFSFTHEFATQHDDDDCDLSSLSLGEIPTTDNPRSPFSLSSYSPCASTNSLFSPSRPVLHPSRLTNTSWVAGGYWTPPGQTQLQSISRSSSHSSGFVSGTPSLANCPSPPGSLHNFGSSLPMNTIPSPYYQHPAPDMDRFSVLSEPAYQFPHLPPHPRTYAASVLGSAPPRTGHQVQLRRPTLDDCLSDTSLDRHSQVSQTSQTSISQTKAGWSLTITVTPTGLILATSIAVNVALAVMWLRQGVEGV